MICVTKNHYKFYLIISNYLHYLLFTLFIIYIIYYLHYLLFYIFLNSSFTKSVHQIGHVVVQVFNHWDTSSQTD